MWLWVVAGAGGCFVTSLVVVSIGCGTGYLLGYWGGGCVAGLLLGWFGVVCCCLWATLGCWFVGCWW